MLKYVLLIFAMVIICHGQTQQNPNTRASHSRNSSNNHDVEDFDDFVPFNSDRNDGFDWKLIKKVLLNDANSNIILSPFSVKLLLALLSEAAGQNSMTEKELSSILPNILTAASTRELFTNILNSLNTPNEAYTLKVGTQIFADSFITPQQRYANIIQSAYRTEITNLNFNNPSESAQIINHWCSNITNGYINDLVSSGDIENSVMLMLNAIYFDGLWRKPFFENNTFEHPFFIEPSRNVKVNYMTQTDYFFFFESTQLNAKILRLPYKGKKFAMTLIAPNSKGGLSDLIEQLGGDQIKRMQWLMDEVQVKVTIPKLKFEYTSQLKAPLEALGITEIFTESASLPGLARGAVLQNRLKVSNIIQKAGLIVHEKGSTAYAATEVVIANKFGGNSIEEFTADRPFVFLIEDETTGAVLFAGKVTDPSRLV